MHSEYYFISVTILNSLLTSLELNPVHALSITASTAKEYTKEFSTMFMIDTKWEPSFAQKFSASCSNN